MHVVHTAIFPPICLDLCGHSLKKKKEEEEQQQQQRNVNAKS